MGRHGVSAFESFVGDAAPVRGRTVVGLGIALGLVVGLGTWVLSDPPNRRQPLSVVQPANLPPPDVMAPSLDPPPVVGTDGLGAAPLPEPSEPAGRQPADRQPVDTPSTPATPPPARPPEATVALTARYDTRQSWNVGFVSDIQVTNRSAVAQSFQVRLDLPRDVRLTNQIWNASADRYSGSVTFRGGPVAAGQTLTFGFVADKSPLVRSARLFEPKACSVNGNPCDGFSSDRGDSYDGTPWSRLSAQYPLRFGLWRYG